MAHGIPSDTTATRSREPGATFRAPRPAAPACRVIAWLPGTAASQRLTPERRTQQEEAPAASCGRHAPPSATCEWCGLLACRWCSHELLITLASLAFCNPTQRADGEPLALHVRISVVSVEMRSARRLCVPRELRRQECRQQIGRVDRDSAPRRNPRSRAPVRYSRIDCSELAHSDTSAPWAATPCPTLASSSCRSDNRCRGPHDQHEAVPSPRAQAVHCHRARQLPLHAAGSAG